MQQQVARHGPRQSLGPQPLMQTHHLADRHNAPMRPIDRAIQLHIQNLGWRGLLHEPVERAREIVQVRLPHEFGRGRATSEPSDATGARPRCCWLEPLSRIDSSKNDVPDCFRSISRQP